MKLASHAILSKDEANASRYFATIFNRMPEPSEISVGGRIKFRRRAMGLTQAQLAQRVGVHLVTLARYEAGRIQIGERKLRELSEALQTTPAALIGGAPARNHAATPAGAAFPDAPPRTRRLAPRVYELVHGYLARLEAAGCTPEQIDEAERLMIDFSFSKLHKRDPRDRTEADQTKDVNALWLVIAESLRDEGVAL
jgi:transcriptional regulator with XRE-family HTH domain